jgi:acyl-CoA dehydrogenase
MKLFRRGFEMDFDLTVEQSQLRNVVREFLKKEIAPLSNEYESRHESYTRDLTSSIFKKLLPFGYLGGIVPEDGGGMGLDFLSYGLLLEELAQVSPSLALLDIGQSIASRYVIYKFASPELKNRYLSRLLSGELLGASALTEPDVGSGARDIKTSAVLDGKDYVLNGIKCWSTGGDIADIILVTAVRQNKTTSKDYTIFLVDKQQSKFTTSVYHKLGTQGASSAEIVFEDCRVPQENIVGTPGSGLDATLDFIGLGRLSCATISLGIAEVALAKSVEYAQQRKQFGRLIGKFQLVQEMIADMATEIECGRLLCYKGWDLLTKGQGNPKAFSMAKYYNTEMAIRVTSKAIEIHGAYGLSDEYPVEKYFRDARCMTFPDATSEIQKLIIGREILGCQAFT